MAVINNDKQITNLRDEIRRLKAQKLDTTVLELQVKFLLEKQ
jgi:hypothetical protein